MQMQRFGNIICPSELGIKLPARLVAMKSWDNKAFRSKTWDQFNKTGLYWESVFDAAHGRRYVLFLFKTLGHSPLTGELDRRSNQAMRKACFDALAKG